MGKTPLIFHSIKEFIAYRDALPATTRVGFVPTMGALHAGHAQLLARSSAENEINVLSIYVNPTQFNNPEDLKKYPKTWEADLQLASAHGVNVVLVPVYEEIYVDQYRYQISENDFSKKLCGAHRPGHFDGVLTIVMKLLQIVRPQRAYFGEKDFQQLRLIQDLAGSFFVRTEIIPVPTMREEDGLAMSSRNVRLTPEGRKKAPLIYQALKAHDLNIARKQLDESGIEVEYLEEIFNRRFVAAIIDGVRLIDNVAL